MEKKKNTTDACKQKHAVDVVGKVVLITEDTWSFLRTMLCDSPKGFWGGHL
jgi:hypothetical protein